MKTIKGNLILKKDTIFKESIKVEGDIIGFYSLRVVGNINAIDINARDINARNIDARDINAWNIKAWNINAMDIKAGNINAWDINARDINARDIDARDIYAWDIICEKRIKKTEMAKTFCRSFIQNKSKLKRKEWKI